MRAEKLYNILEGFNFEILDNPEFKEDSVREELILPIIKGLGYSVEKPYQIIRSRNLLHPFVSIGSQQKKINIIPDYLFEVNGKPAWVLDAKSPTESIVKSKHVEQAYSYAIHSEVRVKYFALCNGNNFVLYSIDEIEPLLNFPLKAIPLYWQNLKKFLSPEKVFDAGQLIYAKDLGLHLKRLGFDNFDSLIFPDVPISHIGQLDDNMFSLSGCVVLDDTRYVVTFDFDNDVFGQLTGRVPDEAIQKLSQRGSERRAVEFGDSVFPVTIDCKIGDKLEENDKEIFLPLRINKIIN